MDPLLVRYKRADKHKNRDTLPHGTLALFPGLKFCRGGQKSLVPTVNFFPLIGGIYNCHVSASLCNRWEFRMKSLAHVQTVGTRPISHLCKNFRAWGQGYMELVLATVKLSFIL